MRSWEETERARYSARETSSRSRESSTSTTLHDAIELAFAGKRPTAQFGRKAVRLTRADAELFEAPQRMEALRAADSQNGTDTYSYMVAFAPAGPPAIGK